MIERKANHSNRYARLPFIIYITICIFVMTLVSIALLLVDGEQFGKKPPMWVNADMPTAIYFFFFQLSHIGVIVVSFLSAAGSVLLKASDARKVRFYVPLTMWLIAAFIVVATVWSNLSLASMGGLITRDRKYAFQFEWPFAWWFSLVMVSLILPFTCMVLYRIGRTAPKGVDGASAQG